MRHEEVVRVACLAGLSPAQALVQWSLRHGVAVAPKCSSAEHADELLAAARADAPALSAEHMAALDALAPPGGGSEYRVIDPPFMRGYW